MTTTLAAGGTARLGSRTVARIGLGTMGLAEAAARGAGEAGATLLREAVALGVDHLDTAAFYGDGAGNDLIRRALAPYDDALALATKVGAVRVDGRLRAAQRPEELRAQVEANLIGLGVERVAVVNLRRVDAPPGIVAEGDQVVPLADQLAELVALRDEGKLEGIGLSNVSAAQLEAALPAGIVCVQNSHSVLDRSSEPVLALGREERIAWVPFCPLGSAFDHLPKVADHEVVRRIAAERAVSPAQVGLAWELAHYEHTLVIAGTTSLEHLRANLSAGDVLLDADDLAELDRIGRAPADVAAR